MKISEPPERVFGGDGRKGRRLAGILMTLLATGLIANTVARGFAGGGKIEGSNWAELTVEVGARSGSRASRATLTCSQTGAHGTGFLRPPRAELACQAVGVQRQLLEKGPDLTRICIQSFEPDVARVRGTLSGMSIDRNFSRGNGCAMGDWDSLAALLGTPKLAGGLDAREFVPGELWVSFDNPETAVDVVRAHGDVLLTTGPHGSPLLVQVSAGREFLKVDEYSADSRVQTAGRVRFAELLPM